MSRSYSNVVADDAVTPSIVSHLLSTTSQPAASDTFTFSYTCVAIPMTERDDDAGDGFILLVFVLRKRSSNHNTHCTTPTSLLSIGTHTEPNLENLPVLCTAKQVGPPGIAA